MSANTWKFRELKFPKPDFGVIEEMYKDAIERVNEAQDGADVLEILFEHNELVRRTNDLLTASFIRHTLDTTDERYIEEQRWADEYRPQFARLALDFSEAIYNSPYKDYIEEKVGPMYFIKMEKNKRTYCEENIPLRQREAELASQYQRIMARCQKEVDGEPRSLMELQNLLEHEDREVRRKAFRAFSEFISENEEALENTYDELVKVRTEIAKNLGYDSFVPVGYWERDRIDYGREEIAKFRQQVLEEVVPLCNRLFDAQARRLGLDHVMVYDEKIIFADGNAKPVGDKEYMLGQIFQILREMSPETEEFITFMLDHELIDYRSRPGKAAREYTTMLTSRKAPFIFSHFDGLPSDVQFLTEGLGHAFAAYRAARKQPLDEYYSSSADIMEIHSMSMTQFVSRYADRFFGEDAWKYEFGNMQNFLTFIPFGVAVDEFQHICYDNPNLTPKERTHVWHELEEKYMPWRRYDEDDEFMNRGGYWYHKIHFFLYPLYYIEYSLATINALEMYRKYVERPGTAWKEYLDLADVGGSKGCVEILKLANLTPAYEDGAVAHAIGYVKKFLEEYIEEE